MTAVDCPMEPNTEFSKRGSADRAVGGWLAWADAAQGGLTLDILLFVASTIFAAITAQNRAVPAHAAWGAIAVWGYGASTALTLAAIVARRVGAPSRFSGTAARATLSTVTFVSTALLPMVVEAVQRASGRLDRAQSEVPVIEHAGDRLWHTGTPYLSVDALAALPASARLEAYVPYQPGMALYGLPSTFAGETWWTDPRMWFAATLAVTVLAAIWLLRRPGDATRDRLLLRAVQALSILPFCALTIATGGDDLAVLGFCVLAFALAVGERFAMAGVAVGVAGAIKLFAWPVAIVLLALAATKGRATAARYAIGAIGVSVAALVPPILADPDAVMENVIRFPLGLGLVSSPAASPLPGHLIAEGMPGGEIIATALLLVTGAAIGGGLLWRPPRSAARAATVSAWGLLAAILLMPASRFGYLLYPIAYAVWAAVLQPACDISAIKPSRWLAGFGLKSAPYD